jgi:hypothetical protein
MSRAKVCAAYSLYIGTFSLQTLTTETSGAGGAEAALDALARVLHADNEKRNKTVIKTRNILFIP